MGHCCGTDDCWGCVDDRTGPQPTWLPCLSAGLVATCPLESGGYFLYGWLHGQAGGYELLLSHCCIRKPLVLIGDIQEDLKVDLASAIVISVEKLPKWLPPAVLSLKRVPVASCIPGRLFNISKCVWLSLFSNCCLCTGTWGVWAFECVPLIRVKSLFPPALL